MRVNRVTVFGANNSLELPAATSVHKTSQKSLFAPKYIANQTSPEVS